MKNGRKKLSIIIPVYNVEKYLTRCLDRLLPQCTDNVQVILVDDGSYDNCPKICDNYAVQYPFVEVIHKQNAGLACARNTGLCAATGEFVTFIDSDDYVTEDYVRCITEKCTTTDVLVFGYMIIFDDTGTVLEKEPKQKANLSAKEALRIIEQNGLFNVVWNKCYRRALLAENDILFTPKSEPGEDLLFNVMCFKKAMRVAMIEQKLYCYMRQGEDTLANQFRADLAEKNELFIRNRIDLYSSLGMTESKDQELLARGNLEYVMACIPNMYRKHKHIPRKKRLDFYRKAIASKTLNLWLRQTEQGNMLIRLFRCLYYIGSAGVMDFCYLILMWGRNVFSKAWNIIRTKFVR